MNRGFLLTPPPFPFAENASKASPTDGASFLSPPFFFCLKLKINFSSALPDEEEEEEE